MNHTSFEYSGTETARYALSDGCELKVYQNVSGSELHLYLERLRNSDGLELYAEHTIGENQYYSYLTAEKELLHVAYTAGDQSLRITYEPLKGRFRDLPPLYAEEYKKICEPNLTVMALDYSRQSLTDSNGMSYVLRLEDGSFVIFDGGYMWDAPRLFSYLLDKTVLPDRKIVISAWIFTHSHGDHDGCFIGFSRLFAERVSVKYFVLNAPPADPSIIRPDRHDNFLCEDFFQFAERYNGAKIVRIHSGQTFALPGMQMEFMQTFEDIMPECMSWLNEASLVTRVYLGGQSILFMGDSEILGVNRLSLFGSTLKSDFLQVPHHGFSGGTPELYGMIDPQYLMWTTNYECYSFRTMRNWSHGLFWALLNSENIKYSFVADGAAKIIPLPFHEFKEIEFYRYKDLLDVENKQI